MSESAEDRLNRLFEEVLSLEQQIDKFREDNKLRIAVGQLITHERDAEGYALQARLSEARQRLTSLILASTRESSLRLEAATRNLQQSSEAQVKVAESQAEAINNILKSSRTIEQFSLFLILLTIVNIFIVESVSGLLQGALGIGTAITLLALIFILMAIAYRWPKRLLRRSRSA